MILVSPGNYEPHPGVSGLSGEANLALGPWSEGPLLSPSGLDLHSLCFTPRSLGPQRPAGQDHQS